MTSSEDTASTLATVFRDSGSAGPVLVADGYGLQLSVRHGHLEVHDGVGPHRRIRVVPRAQRTVSRIVVRRAATRRRPPSCGCQVLPREAHRFAYGTCPPTQLCAFGVRL